MSTNSNTYKINPTAAGLTGLMLGVAAGATAVVLSDPKARQKASDQMDKMSHRAKQVYQEASSRLQRAQQEWQKQRASLPQPGELTDSAELDSTLPLDQESK